MNSIAELFCYATDQPEEWPQIVQLRQEPLA